MAFPCKASSLFYNLDHYLSGRKDCGKKVLINTGEGPQKFAKKKPSDAYLVDQSEVWGRNPSKKRRALNGCEKNEER